MPIVVDIELLLDMLQNTIKDPADRWQALRELLKLNKNKPKVKATNSKTPKRGRPRKVDAP